MGDLVYLNGELVPETQASVSVLDRGFLFGDGVYEVIPAYGGRLFRLPQHLDRLDNSLEAIRLTNPLSRERWTQVCEQVLAGNGGGDQSLYVQVTRGPAKRDHGFPAEVHPTVLVMANPIVPVADEVKARGVAAVTAPDIRWQYCHIKAITLLPNILLRQQALDQGAAEAILIREGFVTEGAASNVFMVRDGLMTTPPKSPYLLPGITRDLVMELATAHDLPAREAPIAEDALRAADEIWVTSSTKEVLPVTRLDERPVGDGVPGPVWQRMNELYQAYKRTLRGN